jgi:putative endonuclease
MPKTDNRTDKRKLGDIGEKIACDYLVINGFEIVERNYLKKWGEIDIVARKSGLIHFIEVKSIRQVSSETSQGYRPEENMHPWKLARLARVMQSYLLEKKLDSEWQLDLITVKIDEAHRKAEVEIIENVII